MPLPPVTRDYITVGGEQAVSSYNKTLWTWGQVRVAVVASPHSGFDSTVFWDNQSHHYDYYNNGINGIEAVDAEGRLFRGQPFSVVGYNDWSTPNTPPTPDDQRFFYGGFVESPPDSGNFIPSIGSGLDIEEQPTILGGATFVGAGATVTTTAPSYDNSDPDGQNIGPTATGTISSVTLAF